MVVSVDADEALGLFAVLVLLTESFAISASIKGKEADRVPPYRAS